MCLLSVCLALLSLSLLYGIGVSVWSVCLTLLSLSVSLLYGIAMSLGLSGYLALQKMCSLTHNISGFLHLEVPTDMVQEQGYNATDLISAQRTSNRHSNKDLKYLSWGLCTLYLLACQVRVSIDDSGHCCCGFFV